MGEVNERRKQQKTDNQSAKRFFCFFPKQRKGRDSWGNLLQKSQKFPNAYMCTKSALMLHSSVPSPSLLNQMGQMKGFLYFCTWKQKPRDENCALVVGDAGRKRRRQKTKKARLSRSRVQKRKKRLVLRCFLEEEKEKRDGEPERKE